MPVMRILCSRSGLETNGSASHAQIRVVSVDMSEITDRVARPGLRERKKQQARSAMTEAALELFWDGGYATTTLEELIDRADVSMRTFFRYFDSKQAVALAAEHELWDALLTEVADAPIEKVAVVDLLERCVVAAVQGLDEDWDRRFITTRGLAASSPEIFDASNLATLRVQRQLVEILEHRLGIDGRNEIRLRLVCDMAMSAWRAGAQSWVRRGRRDLASTPRPEPRATLVHLVGESFGALPASLLLPT